MYDQTLLPHIISLAKQASAAILKIYHQETALEINNKIDNSPLTIADLTAHAILTEGLKTLTPEYPILSEESAYIDYTERQTWQTYWLIDPLDGTKEFIHHTGEFSINIALIQNHQPVFGLIYAPITDECAYAIRGVGAFKLTQTGTKTVLLTHEVSKNTATVIMSRRHGRKKFLPLMQDFAGYHIIELGSALKFINIAEGQADLYPRFGPSGEWDTAAGQCIVEAAGGKVVDLAGNVLQYNTKDSLLNPEFIAVGDKNYDWLKFLEKL